MCDRGRGPTGECIAWSEPPRPPKPSTSSFPYNMEEVVVGLGRFGGLVNGRTAGGARPVCGTRQPTNVSGESEQGRRGSLFTSKRALRALAIVAVLGVVGAACAKKATTTSSSGGAKKAVKIAYIGALTGDYALLVKPGFTA